MEDKCLAKQLMLPFKTTFTEILKHMKKKHDRQSKKHDSKTDQHQNMHEATDSDIDDDTDSD